MNTYIPENTGRVGRPFPYGCRPLLSEFVSLSTFDFNIVHSTIIDIKTIEYIKIHKKSVKTCNRNYKISQLWPKCDVSGYFLR